MLKREERGKAGSERQGRTIDSVLAKDPLTPLLCCVALGQFISSLDLGPAVLCSVQLSGA